ncbi:MAG: glycoside hydrolase family 2 TIM barrel-domain containing protein [Cyanobacteria bacterium P01_A01_bin.40]
MRFKLNRNRYICYLIAATVFIFGLVSCSSFFFSIPQANLATAATRLDRGVRLEPLNTAKTASQITSLAGTWQFIPESKLPENKTKRLTSKHNSFLVLQPTKKLPIFPPHQWQDIKVPANWWLEGQNLSGVVWYRHRFKFSPQSNEQLVKLVFAGVDYTADVWLNGEYLGFHEGYFQPFSFLVEKQLKTIGDNELIVRVNSPLEPQITDWSLHKRLIKGVLGHHDARPGGAWSDRGQEQNTGGIWHDVYLQTSNQLTIDRVKITPEINFSSHQGKAKVDLALTYPGKRAAPVDIQLQLTPDNFVATPGKVKLEKRLLQPGVNHFRFDVIEQNPHLWQTWDRGQPNLYNLQVNLTQSGQLLAGNQTKFGFRSIEYDQQDMVWKLNGQRIFIRGTNYIGSQWLSELTPEKTSFDVGLIKQANINAVRVHAHITHPSFYDLCDRMGILVWQDFPLQWGYREDAEFIKQATAQGKDMINLLYNHPAIMAWSLHNEPPWDAEWMKYLYQNYDPEQNKQLDNELYASLQNLDPSRYLHYASTVREHPWWGWYSATWRKYAEPTAEPLITEYGAQALPQLSSLRRIFSEDELYPDTEEEWAKWKYHNFQPKETFEIAKVPMGDNVQEFIDNTQQYQAKLTKFAAESYRRQRYQPVSAIFQFMFVENWASINWAVVDYWRNPKPGYEALKIAYQPVLPIVSSQQDNWELGQKINLDLTIVNDLWQVFPDARVSYTLQRKWQHLKEGEIAVALQPDSLTKLTTIDFTPWQVGNYELVAVIRDRDGKFLGQNTFDFSITVPK